MDPADVDSIFIFYLLIYLFLARNDITHSHFCNHSSQICLMLLMVPCKKSCCRLVCNFDTQLATSVALWEGCCLQGIMVSKLPSVTLSVVKSLQMRLDMDSNNCAKCTFHGIYLCVHSTVFQKVFGWKVCF